MRRIKNDQKGYLKRADPFLKNANIKPLYRGKSAFDTSRHFAALRNLVAVGA
jgi:hypothetical protein